MDDLISRDELIKAYLAAHKGPPGGALKLIQEAPAVDAEPIRRGRWIKEPDRHYHWHCSECGFVEGIRVEMGINKYCSNCEAKNGGVNDD